MARRSGLTDEVHEHIVHLLREGNFLETAAEAAGVSHSQARSWLKLGREPGSKYERFRLDVLQAMASAESRGVEVLIRLAAEGDLKAVTWWLERRHPARWGQKVRHVVDQELDDAIARVESLEDELGSDVVTRVLEALAGVQGTGAARIPQDDGSH